MTSSAETADAGPMSRSEAKEQTRQLLARATIELVAQNGYRETTVEQIAQRVGVVPRTFFRHFPSKEAALFAQEDAWVEVLEAALEDQPAESALLPAVRAAMAVVADAIQTDGRWILELMRFTSGIPAVKAHAESGIGQKMAKCVFEWAQHRLGAPAVVDPRSVILAGLASTCAHAAMVRWIAHSGNLDLPTLIGESFEAIQQLQGPDGDTGEATGERSPSA